MRDREILRVHYLRHILNRLNVRNQYLRGLERFSDWAALVNCALCRGSDRFMLRMCGKQTCNRRTTSPGALKPLRGSASALRIDL